MSEILNFGEAMLLLGLSYLGITHGFSWWIILLMLLAVTTWSYRGFFDERKENFKLTNENLRLQNKKIEAEIALIQRREIEKLKGVKHG
jgi:hypothetical protein